MGGSQGASGINQALFKSAPLLTDQPLQIIHLTGDRDDRLAAANYQRENIPHYVAAVSSPDGGGILGGGPCDFSRRSRQPQ